MILILGTLTVALPWLGNQTLIGKTSPEHQVEFIQVKGYEQLQQQLALAKADNVPVMLDFYADWCVACKDFETKTFSDPSVEPLLANMRLIQADVTNTDALDIELQDKLAVLGLPSIILFDRQGNELKNLRVVGFQEPAQFKLVVEQALNAVPATQS